MIGNYDFIQVSRRVWISLVFLALSMIVAGPAHAQLACNSCHTMPPSDTSSERNPASGAFKGNHQGHSGNAVASCVPCHGAAVSSYEAKHSAPPPGSGTKPVIRLTSALNNYSIGHTPASYSRGTFFNQTSVPPNPLGTCSSVNCHFEKATPAWGTASFVSPTDCDKCHGAPPLAIDPGSHAKHNTYYQGAANCQKCHPNNTTFQHATSAGNRPLVISFAASPNNGSGAYDGPLNDYLPSQSNNFGKCTSTYCHSNGRSSTTPNINPVLTATWGNNGTLGCVGCHAAPVLLEVGSHYAHVTATYAVSVACYKCHAATVTAGMTISSTTNHVNKRVDIAFSSTTTAVLGKYSGHLSPMQKNPGSGYANCENVYCHSSGQGAGGSWPPTYSAPKWGDSATGACGTCHDAGNHGGTLISSGSHTKHLRYEFDGARSQNMCGSCHYGAGYAEPTCSQCHLGSGKLTTLHVNHQIDVSFTTKFSGTYNGSPEPGNGYGNCTSNYCHSNGLSSSPAYYTPTWGNVASGACGTCHGVTAAVPPASTPHAKHLGSANPYLFACATCHSNKVQATANSTVQPTYTNLTSHVNKLRDVKFNAGSPFGTYSSASLSCRNIYCHSTGNLSVTAGALPAAYNGKIYARQTWSGALACNACHGRSTSNGMPDYTNGGEATTTANSHPKHVSSSAIACVQCHEKTTKNGTTIRNTIPSKHVDGTTHDVFFNLTGLNASGTYNNTRQRCYNIYCHSNGTTASGFAAYSTAPWGKILSCTGCHNSNFASGKSMATGSHGNHINWMSASVYAQDFKCVKCHAVTAKADMTILNGSRHINEQIEIAFDSSSSAANGFYMGTPATPTSPMNKAPGSAKGSCTNVYCHSSGQGVNGSWPPTYYTTPAWGVTDMKFCGSCHATTDAHGGSSFGFATPLVTGSHDKHLKYQMAATNATYDRCVVCHAYRRTGFSSSACNSGLCHGPTYQKHSNYELNVNIPVYFGASSVYNGTTKPGHDGAGYTNSTCSLVYCHSNGLAVSPTYVTPKWGDPATAQCGTCHGANAAAPPASTRHTKHVGNASQYQYTCALCHNRIVKHNANSSTYAVISTATDITQLNGSRLHVNKSRDVWFDTMNPFGNYSSDNLSCIRSYCHSTGNTSVAAARLPGAYGGQLYARPKWTDVGPLACNACHGRSTSNGMPDYVNGKMGSLSSNSHPKHVTSSSIACVECHEKTTKTGTTIRSTFPSKHVDGTNHDVYFNLSGLSPSGIYDNVQRKCSTTYCHGTGASLAWGGTTYCNSCHSANAGTTGGGGINNWGNTPLSAHKLHVEDTSTLPWKYANYSTGNLSVNSTTYRFGCASCHLPGTGKASHVSGYASNPYRAQVFFGYTTPGKTPNYTYTVGAGTADNGFGWSTGSAVCNSTYCHSDGNGGAGTAVSWTTTANSATATRCKLCHGYTTASGTLINTYKHAKHVNGTTYSFSCAKCHNLTTTDGSTIADRTKHVNKKKDVAWDTTNSDGSGYVNSTTACANIYCHSQGTTFTQPYTGAGKAPVTAVTWSGGQTLGCNGCHGNSNGYTVGTYRIATPLYASGSPKGNAHQLHVDARLGTDAGAQCLNCHNATTTNNTNISIYANHVNEAYTIGAGGTFANGDAAGGAAISVTASYTYNAAGSTCSNVSCHPTGLTGAKATDVVPWSDKHSCDDCHNVNMKNNTGYHHAMRNYSGSGSAYPNAVPGATAGANDVSRRCTMCHVDHNTFSPNLNASNSTYGSAGNLRMSIISSVTATKGYINRDFFKTGSGGICISCHNSELFKDTGNVRVKNETSSTKTPAIVLNNYTGSAHEYAISSAMKRDSKVFYADCSKCHNSRKGETAQFSSMTTATHDSNGTRIFASLGTDPTTGIDANFCYRCHSNATDATGGTRKPVDLKDFYNIVSMRASSEDLFTVFNGVGVSSYTTTNSSTLYLRDTGAINAVPPSPADPVAYQYSSGTYTTTTFTQKDMAATVGATGTTTVVSTGATAARYDRGIQFVSPQIDNTVAIASGSSFTLTLNEVRAFGTSTDYTRVTVYKWDGTTATPLNTTAAPNNYAQNATAIPTTAANRVTTFTTNSAVTLNPGDALICDVEFNHSAGTTALNVTYSYGNNSGTLALPAGTYNWRTAATAAKPGHGVNNPAYAGKHRPSPTDETLAYIAANKHVSCNDCHDPHEARFGNFSTNTIARGSRALVLPNVLKGAIGTRASYTVANTNWTRPTQATYSSPRTAVREYQICFKCHSGAIDLAGSWFRNMTTSSLGSKKWTDLGLEFNPNNEAYHPVIQALPSTGNRRLAAGALTGGWVPGSVMTCSDCHASDSSASQGPHGSSVKWMLNPNTNGTKNYNWPYTAAANNGLNTGTLLTGTGTSTVPTTNFCFSCHVWSGGGQAHTGCSSHAIACVGCHIRVPHGGKLPRLLTSTNAPDRYMPDGNGGGTVYLGGVSRPASGTLGSSQCKTAGGCSAHNGTSTFAW